VVIHVKRFFAKLQAVGVRGNISVLTLHATTTLETGRMDSLALREPT